jgi:hypothetical protein
LATGRALLKKTPEKKNLVNSRGKSWQMVNYVHYFLSFWGFIYIYVKLGTNWGGPYGLKISEDRVPQSS